MFAVTGQHRHKFRPSRVLIWISVSRKERDISQMVNPTVCLNGTVPTVRSKLTMLQASASSGTPKAFAAKSAAGSRVRLAAFSSSLEALLHAP